MPYGHGIGIAYYHTVLDQDQLSEQTLKQLIQLVLTNLVQTMSWQLSTKEQGKNGRARRTIETAFERGGVNDTNIVVSYAVSSLPMENLMKRWLCCSTTSLLQTIRKIISTILEMCT